MPATTLKRNVWNHKIRSEDERLDGASIAQISQACVLEQIGMSNDAFIYLRTNHAGEAGFGFFQLCLSVCVCLCVCLSAQNLINTNQKSTFVDI